MAAFDHWMKFNIGDYLADTMHLSTFQHGIYVMLIMHYFKRGELPNDDSALRRIAKVNSPLIWRREAAPVLAMWKHENGVLRHSRIDATRAEAQRLSETRRNAGQMGARARWPMANAMSEDGNCHDGLACARGTTTKAKANPPPVAPRGGRGRGSPIRNGFTESVMEDLNADAADPPSGGTNVVPIARGPVSRKHLPC